MRAVQLVSIGDPLQDMEIPDPEMGRNDVVVRVAAAGVCHSDVHYRAGTSPVGPLPLTPGHEVAGVVEQVGSAVLDISPGDRVCLHYMVTCGLCPYCVAGTEQFCRRGQMIGKHRDGGYADYISVPERGVVPVPDSVSLEHAAVMMCSTATSYHALRKARLRANDRVAVLGAGGLGLSAIQLARAMGASEVYAVDINSSRLDQAAALGATVVHAGEVDPLEALAELTGDKGVDVAVELVGLPRTMAQAVGSLAVFGRAVLVGITQTPFEVDSYRELIGKEAEVMGSSDHLLSELPELLAMVTRGALDLEPVVTDKVALRAGEINATLDALESFSGASRTVIIP